MRTEKNSPLSLHTDLLKRLAKKANMSRSEYVRELIAKEANKIEKPFEVSEENYGAQRMP